MIFFMIPLTREVVVACRHHHQCLPPLCPHSSNFVQAVVAHKRMKLG